MRRLVLGTLMVIATVFATPTWAQSKPGESTSAFCEPATGITTECRRDFEAWEEKEKKWREYLVRLGNFAMIRSGRDRIHTPFPQRPKPPVWLPGYCEPVRSLGLTSTVPVCVVFEEYLKYDWVQHVVGPAVQIEHSSKVPIGLTIEDESFAQFLFKNLHIDGLWTNSSSGSRIYGYFGAHVTLARIGRIYLWGPPGFLMIRDRDDQVKVKMSWGVDVYLGHLPFPFVGKRPVFLSLAKIFDSADSVNILKNPQSGENMIGFSVTFKR